MKGQSSMEFLFMIAFLFIVIASFTVPHMMNPARETTNRTLSVSRTKTACDKIANAINGISSSGDNSIDSLGISIPNEWDLNIQSDPSLIKMTVYVKGKSVKVKNKLDYGFDASKSSISPGYYTVMVEKRDEEGLTKSENVIEINLNPG